MIVGLARIARMLGGKAAPAQNSNKERTVEQIMYPNDT